ncbi:hypothetical protein AB0F24_17440 [Streptomyces platensis]|uniref:hypothetical protein n=1 Tax=Streptomyces platensis TaxID=58346 RepID=UPI0033EC2782
MPTALLRSLFRRTDKEIELTATQTTTNSPAAEQPNVLMRFLTQGGATVELTKAVRAGRGTTYPFECLGCGYDFDNYSSIVDAREYANDHAEKCRAMPRPVGE